MGTDVDMASLEDSYKDPANNGYFCRQVRFNDKTYFCFFKKDTLASALQKLFELILKTDDATRLLLGTFFKLLPLG